MEKGTELVVKYTRAGNATAVFPLKPDSNNTARVYLTKEALEKTVLITPAVHKKRNIKDAAKLELLKGAIIVVAKSIN